MQCKLGVPLDTKLSFDKHLNKSCQASYFHIRALRQVRRSVSADIVNSVACTIIGASLGSCNSILYDISDNNISKLQGVRHMHQKEGTHNTSATELQWPPASARVTYKIAMITAMIMQACLPEYLSVAVHPATCSQNLCSTGIDILNIPDTKSTPYNSARHAYAYAVPTIWNSLLANIRTITMTSAYGHLPNTSHDPSSSKPSLSDYETIPRL